MKLIGIRKGDETKALAAFETFQEYMLRRFKETEKQLPRVFRRLVVHAHELQQRTHSQVAWLQDMAKVCRTLPGSTLARAVLEDQIWYEDTLAKLTPEQRFMFDKSLPAIWNRVAHSLGILEATKQLCGETVAACCTLPHDEETGPCWWNRAVYKLLVPGYPVMSYFWPDGMHSSGTFMNDPGLVTYLKQRKVTEEEKATLKGMIRE